MENNESYASEVWLLTGYINSLPGILSLENSKLTFTALGTGTYWESGLKKLEIKSGNQEFRALLKREKPAILFSVALNDIQKITYPFIYFSAGAHLFFYHKKFRLSFIAPNNSTLGFYDRSLYRKITKTNVVAIEGMSHARSVCKKWRSLLSTCEKLLP